VGGQPIVKHAELDTCSCGPWTNLVMCIWPGSAACVAHPCPKHQSWLTVVRWLLCLLSVSG